MKRTVQSLHLIKTDGFCITEKRGLQPVQDERPLTQAAPIVRQLVFRSQHGCIRMSEEN